MNVVRAAADPFNTHPPPFSVVPAVVRHVPQRTNRVPIGTERRDHEFPDVVGNLSRDRSVHVAGEKHDRLVDPVQLTQDQFTLVNEAGESITLGPIAGIRTNMERAMRYDNPDARDNKE